MSSVLSGPAGGLIGMGWVGRRLGVTRLIGFDMETSTDVSLIDENLPRRFEHVIAGVRLQPMLDVHTIAAGGGSIVNFSDGRFAVGPASAGSAPDRRATGAVGLPLTDVQVLLGRLRPDTLPAVFGRDGRARIDDGCCVGVRRSCETRSRDDGTRANARGARGSFLEVGVEAMADAIRQISTRQGLDADDSCFVLEARRGQHACSVARAAGMRRILVHPLASVLSAFGIGVADRLAVRRASLRLRLTGCARCGAQAAGGVGGAGARGACCVWRGRRGAPCCGAPERTERKCGRRESDKRRRVRRERVGRERVRRELVGREHRCGAGRACARSNSGPVIARRVCPFLLRRWRKFFRRLRPLTCGASDSPRRG